MGKRYEHLGIEEREAIGQMHWQGMSKTTIAKAIGRQAGIKSRELMRNASEQYKRYKPCQAQKRAEYLPPWNRKPARVDKMSCQRP